MFRYHGKVPGLIRYLERNRERLRRAYVEVLGSKTVDRIQRAEDLLIGEYSFFDPTEKMLPGTTAVALTNGLLNWIINPGGATLTIMPDGFFDYTKDAPPLLIAPAFSFSDQGFRFNEHIYGDWASVYEAGYIHAYTSFAIFALQKLPMLAAEVVALSKLPPVPAWPLTYSEIDRMASSLEDRVDRLIAGYLAVTARELDEIYQTSARQIDVEVMRRMGVKVPKEYYPSTPREYGVASLPTVGLNVLVPVSGDPHYGVPMSQRIGVLSNWEHCFNAPDPFQQNFLSSLKKLPFRKACLTQEDLERADTLSS